MSARILDVTAAEYHADPCATPSLSRSVALELITRSEFHARRMHPRLGQKAPLEGDDEESDDAGEEATPAMNDGTIYHALLLAPHEDPREVVVTHDPKTGEVVYPDKYTTKLAREARDAIKARGKVPTKQKDFDRHNHGAERFRDGLLAAGIDLSTMDREVAIEWSDDGVLCRSRLDTVCVNTADNRIYIYDIKAMADGSAAALRRAFVKYGYDIEAHAHVKAIEQMKPEYAGRVEWVPVTLELNTWQVTPHFLGGAMLELGRVRWENARERWRRALESNEWPGYPTSTIDAEPYDLQRWGASV